jgi:hypothetical protein
MRKVIEPPLALGQIDIGAIVFNPKSRDDIPQILCGLQHLYLNPDVRRRVFARLEEALPERAEGKGKVSPDTGRPGMAQWTILVLGVLRLGLNADYDRLHELANEHKTLRLRLGVGDWQAHVQFELQTLKDNLRRFTPERLDRINQEVVRAGHHALKKSPEDELNARADSFVVETNVEYPTDTGLLYEAVRKALGLAAELADRHGLPGWRQAAHPLRTLNKARRRLQKLKHSTAPDENQRQARQQDIQQAHRDYLERAATLVGRLHDTGGQLAKLPAVPLRLADLDGYLTHAERQLDQVRRRVLHGETIPHAEKVFSIFQPHTEWISQGQAGVPVELGLRVCMVEDQHRFILHHQVMEKTTDDHVAVPVTQAAKQRFPTLTSIRFDKGFHSPRNQTELAKRVERVVLPRKGRRSEAGKRQASEPEFARLRRQHAAVESAINALEHHGLDCCPDHGLDGFKRYVALAVLARNVQRLGAVVKEPAALKLKRQRGPYRNAA